MKLWKKNVVYRSRDREDWLKAQRLLEEAGIEYWPFATEEVPMGGCGAKIHPGKFWGSREASPIIFRIEVATDDKDKTETVLAGKVQPVRPCGFTAI